MYPGLAPDLNLHASRPPLRSHASRALLAQFSLLSITAIWGLTFVLVQDAVARTPVMSFLAERFVLAAALVAVAARHPLRRLAASGWLAGLLMGACLTAGYILQTYGLRHTSAAHSGFITGLFVVFTPLLGGVVLRRRPAPVNALAALVSLTGLALLAGLGGAAHPLGDGLTLGCALAFAVHILVTARATAAHSAAALLAVQLGLCGLTCTLVAAAQGQLRVPADASVGVALLVTAVLASALAYFVQTAAQRYVPPDRTALILTGEPAFAGLFAYLLKHERLSAAGWVGAGLILAAIVLVELVPRHRRPPQPTPEGPAAPELDLPPPRR
jgi:drug/metabolite transporter (DMT)-like permease